MIVTLRNFKLRSCLGIKNLHLRSESQFALILRNRASLKRALHKDVDGGQSWGGQRFLAMEGRKESAAGPLQRMYLAESNAETSAECSQSNVEARRARREQERVHALESLQQTRYSSFASH